MAGLRSAPPPHAAELQRWFLADYPDLQRMRTGLRETLTALAPPAAASPSAELDDVVERMAIVATELATNALVHARSPTVVRLGRTRTLFVLDVTDDRPGVVPQLVDDRPPAAGGLGLHFAVAMANHTGWYVADGTKHVWSTFRIPRGRLAPAPHIEVRVLASLIRTLRRLRRKL